MKAISEIKQLVKIDFIIDKRSKNAFGSTILYMFSTIIICYYTLKDSNEEVWNVLFWIILLFAAINTTSGNYHKTNTYRYIDILTKPIPFIISKLIYNAILIIILGCIEYVLFGLLTNTFNTNHIVLILVVLLGSISLSSILTMLSAIASKTDSNITLVTILGCPIILPCLLTLISLTSGLANDIIDLKSFIPIISLCIIVITSTILLFPYIWRE